MATTETGAARYRATGRDEDDDKHSTHQGHGRKSQRVGAHKIQAWDDRQGQHQEHRDNQVQDAGGKGSAGREDKRKAGVTSGLSKDNTVNRHAQRLTWHKGTMHHTR